jgi:Protein of unknown function (DUF2516)
MAVGAPELLVILLIVPVIPLWALIDALVRPDWAWQQASQNKVAWAVALAVSLLLFLIGTVIGIVYLATVRSQLAKVQRQAAGPAVPS